MNHPSAQKVSADAIAVRAQITPAAIVGLTVAAVASCRLLYLSSLPEARLVQHIPDDAFYYLESARNFARLGRWTFDGIEPNTGFHVVWGYLLSALFWLVPGASLHQVFVWGGLLQGACYAGAAGLVSGTADRLFGRGSMLGVAFVFLSATSLMQSTWLMEVSFVVLSAGVTVWWLCRAAVPSGLPHLAAALCLGAFGSLARSDAGLLTGVLCVTTAVLWQRGHVARSVPLVGLVMCVGAGVGIVAVSIHTQWVSGAWIQASAQQKAFWTSVTGYSILNILHFLLSFVTPLWNAAPVCSGGGWPSAAPCVLSSGVRLFLLGALGWATIATVHTALRGSGHRGGEARAGFLLSMVATIALYLLFYGFNNAAVNSWYVVNFTVPLALVVGAGAAWFSRRHLRLVAVVVGVWVTLGLYFSLRSPWPWQTAMYKAALLLEGRPELRPVAAFNAGILGFFSRSGLINVDGLVNDRILPHARAGTLAHYFAERDVAYLVDFPQVFTQDMPARGGYADGHLQSCVQSLTGLFPTDSDNVYIGGGIHLYQFDRSCLARSPAGGSVPH